MGEGKRKYTQKEIKTVRMDINSQGYTATRQENEKKKNAQYKKNDNEKNNQQQMKEMTKENGTSIRKGRENVK